MHFMSNLYAAFACLSVENWKIKHNPTRYYSFHVFSPFRVTAATLKLYLLLLFLLLLARYECFYNIRFNIKIASGIQLLTGLAGWLDGWLVL